ncbi:cyclic nucleotide-gated cation channel alpha-3-like isoform X1 [Stylophora pistillata]|uniref:cyclic nucleotide-gated cation channel alpha-3-like isoform X1 n=1 Tax=Stylophora pistillata TaxID=50429 RepID=UPI000C05518A|nr:cyclic nucleotide-gated cation channel alpha-3-like isoform X1 [Stylophora pistillata]
MEKAVRFENNEDSEDDETAARQTRSKHQSSHNSARTESNSKHERDNSGDSIESFGKWKTVSKQIRNAVLVKNSVKPGSRSRKRSAAVKSPAMVDPFLQKFSTRDNRKITPPNRKKTRVAKKSSSSPSVLSNAASTKEPRRPQLSIEIEKELDSELASGSVYEYDQAVHWKDKNFIFDPDGMHICVWFYVLVFAIRYNLWALITRIAFPEAQSGFLKIVWFLFDYFCDAIYILDVVIAARTGFLQEGILVIDAKRVYMRYIRSVEFIADVVSLIPTDILYAALGPLPLLRVNRIIKGYKSFRVKAVMESQANYPTFLRVFFLMHLMFLLIHWNAAFYFMISRAEGFGTNEWVYQGNGSLYQQYLQSFYWSTLTLTAIGDLPQPTTNLEYVYTIACYLTGVFMFATIVGNAGSIIVNRNAVRMDFEKQRENTKQYMKKHNVPKDLQRRVVMWYDYSWARGRMSTGGGDLNSLTLLPSKLKTDIALHVNLETLRKVTFLQKCQPEFLHLLVLQMKLRIFTPGDLVCRKGEVAREMYVIIDGKIEVIGDQGQVLKVLSGGDFFGEIGILSLSEGQNRRTADVRTVGYVECFVLAKEDVLSAIRDYPEAQAVLADYGKKRLERQNSSHDPRLVDMDDSKGRDLDTNDYTDHKKAEEFPSKLTTKSVPNGRCRRTSASVPLGRASQPSARAVLEPIPLAKLSRSRRLSSEVELQSAESCSRNVTKAPCSSDELVKKMFNDSYMEAFNFLKKTLDENLAKEMTDVCNSLKNCEESNRLKDENLFHLSTRLSNMEEELEKWKIRVRELESENFIKDQTIRRLREESEDGEHTSSRSRTLSSTVSSSSLMDTERSTSTYC